MIYSSIEMFEVVEGAAPKDTGVVAGAVNLQSRMTRKRSIASYLSGSKTEVTCSVPSWRVVPNMSLKTGIVDPGC